MFRFAHPELLWLLCALPLLVALFWVAMRLRRRRLARFGSLSTLEELMPEVSNGRVVLKFLLLLAALFFLIPEAPSSPMGTLMLVFYFLTATQNHADDLRLNNCNGLFPVLHSSIRKTALVITFFFIDLKSF